MLATARLRLTPDQVMRLTYYQLLAMLDGAAKYIDRRRERFQATMTTNLVNCWLKTPVTVGQLLGEEGIEQRMSEEDRMLDAHRIAEKVFAKQAESKATA